MNEELTSKLASLKKDHEKVQETLQAKVSQNILNFYNLSFMKVLQTQSALRLL